jgi:hypothetical protein
MVLSKLLALLKRKQRKPPIHAVTSTTPDFIIVPPPEQSKAASDSEQRGVPPPCGSAPNGSNKYEERLTQTSNEEKCEEPMPLQTFHAVDVEIAREKAAKKGLLILFKGHERWDLFGRRNIYFALTPKFALSLLRLESDMKSQVEFTLEEQEILRDLALKGWIKRLQNGGVYYYGLNRKTAIILQRQLLIQGNRTD